jgi:hypothetical protein
MLCVYVCIHTAIYVCMYVCMYECCVYFHSCAIHQLGLLNFVQLFLFFDFNCYSIHLHVPELFAAGINL